MPNPKGDKLLVNLGASEARRRLNGFGHGVRKVQSAGRNRAIIIYTANGRHLQELETQFADVGCSRRPALKSSIIQPNSGISAARPPKTQMDQNTLEFD